MQPSGHKSHGHDRLICQGGGSVNVNCSECLCKRTSGTHVAGGLSGEDGVEDSRWRVPARTDS